MEGKYSKEAGRRSCASSPACADVVIGRVCLEVMVYESACGVGLLLGAAPSCQLPSWALLALSCNSACVQGFRNVCTGLSGASSVTLRVAEGGM